MADRKHAVPERPVRGYCPVPRSASPLTVKQSLGWADFDRAAMGV